MSNPYNPYLPRDTPQEPRRKEGVVKKVKAVPQAPKHKINIYEEAQEI